MVGEGIVTFGVRLVQDFRYWKSASWMSFTCRTLSTTRITGRRELLAAVGPLDHDRKIGLDAADLLEEIDVEIGAAEFSVGDRLQAGLFLEFDDFGDRLVLDLAQLGRIDLAARLAARAPRAGISAAGSCRRGRRGMGARLAATWAILGWRKSRILIGLRRS
jgi:hypothetical protein